MHRPEVGAAMMYARFFSVLWWVLSVSSVLGEEQIGLQSNEERHNALRETKLTDLHGDPVPSGAVVRFGTLRLRPCENTCDDLMFTPDGRQIFTGGSEKHTVGLWSLETGAEVFRLQIPHAHCRCAALSSDGKLAAIGTSERTIHIWNLRTKKELSQLRGHSAEVQSVAFSPDGKVLASASWDETVRLWDPATGKTLRQLSHTRMGLLRSIVYSPDGRRLASQDKENIWLWEVATGKLRRTQQCAVEEARIVFRLGSGGWQELFDGIR